MSHYTSAQHLTRGQVMARSKWSLAVDAALIEIASAFLAALSVLIVLIPYAFLWALGLSGLILPIRVFHPGVNLGLTGLLAGWLHIRCFEPFVYPHCYKLFETLRSANSDAKFANWKKRKGIDGSGTD